MIKNQQYSLALGGGSARGLSHIGVIRYLEENNITISAVSGTSMGAIVGTMYALGKTSHDMESILGKIKWLSLVDMDLRRGFVKGVKIEKFFDDIFEGKTFDDLKIPLSIVTTDINTGEPFIISSGRLSHAVRASISLAGIFSPFSYDGRELIDGGFTINLPIDVLPVGPVIAVSAMKDITRKVGYHRNIFSRDWQKTIFGNGYTILQKALEILVTQNEYRSVQSREDLIYIRPEFDGLDYYEFHKYREFIQSGYTKAKEVLS